MTSPWPACTHGDDPTVCPTCVADLGRQLRRYWLNPWNRLRWAWQAWRHRPRPGDPF